MTEQEFKELQQMLLSGKVTDVTHVLGNSSESVQLTFSNGKIFDVGGYSENPEEKGYLELSKINGK